MTAILDSTLTIQVLHELVDGAEIARLVATGEIDASSATTFEAAGHQALADDPDRVDIDLTAVRFLDSSGLRAILHFTAVADDRRIDARITGMSAATRRVLEITQLIDSLRRS